jgi:micrococcal nuclease
MRQISMFVAFIMAFAITAFAETRAIEGTVTRVSDGDTIIVTTDNGTKVKVRLYGADCPEIRHNKNLPGQPLGDEAKAFVSNLVLNKKVRLNIYSIDKYNRTVSMVYLLNGMVNVNLELVKNGLAEVEQQYLKKVDRQLWNDVEKVAKDAKKGIWGLPNYETPSAYRKRVKQAGKD